MSSFTARPNFLGTEILLVEDDDDTRDMLCVLLGLFGSTVRVARTGDEALALAAEQVPDAILCDVRMPGMDGFALLEKLRADSRLDRVPVLALSGLSSAEHRKMIAKAGFAGYFLKPIDFDALGAQLGRLLTGRASEA